MELQDRLYSSGVVTLQNYRIVCSLREHRNSQPSCGGNREAIWVRTRQKSRMVRRPYHFKGWKVSPYIADRAAVMFCSAQEIDGRPTQNKHMRSGGRSSQQHPRGRDLHEPADSWWGATLLVNDQGNPTTNGFRSLTTLHSTLLIPF